MSSTDESKRPQEPATDDNSKDIPLDLASQHSDNFPRLLHGLGISLAATSYQAQRLILVRSDGEQLDTCFKTYPRPMGVTADSDRLTLGTLNQVLDFRRNDTLLSKIKAGALDNRARLPRKLREQDPELAEQLEQQQAKELEEVKRADALFLSRASLTTGMINIHDIAWGLEGLWVVNSAFSCLATLNPEHNFIARWKPPFIKELVAEDRCHLNGMAMHQRKPGWVTTFNQQDEKDSWALSESDTGTLIEVHTGKILLDRLVLPHSPRVHQGMIYLCHSGEGQVLRIHPESGRLETVCELPGFTRGLAFHGPLMFVGLSNVRERPGKAPLPINKRISKSQCGIRVINLETGDEIAHLRFTGDISQIYDIGIIPNACFPELLGLDQALIRHTFDYLEAYSLEKP